MIAITPQGTIYYISQGYGGRSSDLLITEDTKYLAVANYASFLTKVLPSYKVLADRGFLISEFVAIIGAKIVTPAFKGKRTQLTQLQLDNSRKGSNVIIHVGIVIGQL